MRDRKPSTETGSGARDLNMLHNGLQDAVMLRRGISVGKVFFCAGVKN